jgi:hypothetical protein
MTESQRRLIVGLLFSTGTLLFVLAAASFCFIVTIFPARYAILVSVFLIPLLIVSAQALRFAFSELDGGKQSARLPSSFPSGSFSPPKFDRRLEGLDSVSLEGGWCPASGEITGSQPQTCGIVE